MWRNVTFVVILSMFVLTSGASAPAVHGFTATAPAGEGPPLGVPTALAGHTAALLDAPDMDVHDLLDAMETPVSADAAAAVALLQAAPHADEPSAYLSRALELHSSPDPRTTLPAMPSYPSVVDAAQALHARYGTELPAAQRASLAGVGEPNAGALTTLIEANLFQAESTRLAFRGLDETGVAALHAQAVDGSAGDAHALPFDLGLLAAARAVYAPIVLEASSNLVCDPDGDAVDTGEFQYDLRCEDSVYTNSAHLLIDVGGNDAYHNNAGGGGDGLSTGPCRQPCAAMLVDLGGDDEYRPSMSGSLHFGMTGGANGGSGMLADLAGNDVYHVQYYAQADRAAGAHGGAFLGAGLLFDAAGDDAYVVDLRAPGYAAGGFNGAGNGGSGALIDLGGRDVYDVHVGGSSGVTGNSVAANGAGNFIGTGLLLDGGTADDRYSVSVTSRIQASAQMNGGGGFGRGALLDGGGNDLYTASASTLSGLLSATANGASLVGQGLLVDLLGGDTYSATLTSGANLNSAANGGSGAGAGFLLDLGGDDAYTATASSGTTNFFSANGGGTLGEGHLIDAGGDDRYTVALASGGPLNSGANGGGVIGAGSLYDLGGDDHYIVTATSGDSLNVAANGGVDRGVGQSPLIGGLGLLLDAAGTDQYADPQLDGGACTDCTVAPKGTAGMQVDI